MSKAKIFSIVITVTLLLTAAVIILQTLEMKDYRVFSKFMSGKNK